MKSQQGVDVAQDIRTERQAEEAGTAVQESSFGTILTGQSVVIRKNSGGAEVVQPRLNLIEGVNISITLADDPVGSEADVTFAVTGLTLNKYNATVAPTVNEDSGDGYSVGSTWIDVTADDAYICVDSTLGAAVWKKTTP